MGRLSAKVRRERYGKRPDARQNGRPHRIAITHALKSRALLRDPLDQRTVAGKFHREHVAMLTSDLGGDLSTAMATLVDQASRLHLIAKLGWNELVRTGLFDRKTGEAKPAYDLYLKTTRDERDVLRLLGLERRARPVPSLQTYLGALAAGKEEVADAPDATAV